MPGTAPDAWAALLPRGPQGCSQEDAALARWTFLRYCVLGLILLWRVCRLRRKAEDGEAQCCLKGILDASCLFVRTEGVGLVIYFSVSAVMDNAAIFVFGRGDEAGFCETVKAVSLYSMALVTFLPNVLLGIRLQETCYDKRSCGVKCVFILFMAIITAVSFVVRLWLVYNEGYASLVNLRLESLSLRWRVALSVGVPPLVDGIQSTMLILTGQHSCHLTCPLLIKPSVAQHLLAEMETIKKQMMTLEKQNKQLIEMNEPLIEKLNTRTTKEKSPDARKSAGCFPTGFTMSTG
ncbi:unnamed protein product [Prorocentrum cordatum]|uniref:Protein RFT1 homolog n=1 Tax=Prorocentrum cordatum TaxID=2364126 RepID=A0ABN9Q0A8_9DINO|nr:unnamed protein product [Polarella glacialis]